LNKNRILIKLDAAIIDAGIVDLTIAHRLREKFDSILLAEKEDVFSRQVPIRNMK